MSPFLLPFLLSLAVAAADGGITNSPSPPTSGERLSAYDVLRSYNFPVGLLPKGALGYDLDPATGKFAAYFNSTCSFSIESYKIRYKSTISGQISTNRLTNLRGISVKILLFWINFVEVVRDGGDLVFSVGIASADFPIENFYVCPQCGCGLNCAAIGGLVEEGFGKKMRPSV